MSTAPKTARQRARRYLALGIILAVLVFFAVTFRQVLLPFIMALIIVYLMEPVVKRLNRLHVRKRHLPRWACVIIVYLTFFTAVTSLSALILPPLVSELTNLAEETPKFFEKLRTQYIPSLNRNVQDMLRRLFPSRLSENQMEEVQGSLHQAVDRAQALAFLVGAMTAEERELFLQGNLDINLEGMEPETESPVAFRLVHDPLSGEWRVYIEEVELTPNPDVDRSYLIRTRMGQSEPSDEPFNVDLEQSFSEEMEHLVAASGSVVARLVSFGQGLVMGLLSAFVGLVLTFMVAAFISIDLPRIMSYFRSLVPVAAQKSYDDLLHNLDRGLSGVVRGQLTICVINGVLTGIGLFLFKVKFALVLSLVATVLSLIPVFGVVISSIPSVGIALTQSFTVALLVLGWILMIHFIEANFLNPKIIGTAAHIHPVIVIFALLAGEHSYGLLGALLAVPVASILLTLLKFVMTRSMSAHEPIEEKPP